MQQARERQIRIAYMTCHASSFALEATTSFQPQSPLQATITHAGDCIDNVAAASVAQQLPRSIATHSTSSTSSWIGPRNSRFIVPFLYMCLEASGTVQSEGVTPMAESDAAAVNAGV